MRAGLGIVAVALALAGCVPGQTSMPAHGPASAMAHSCTTTVIGPDGKPQQALIEADDAGAAALLCADGQGPVAKPKTTPAPKPVVKPAPVLKAPVVQAPAPSHPVTTTAPLGTSRDWRAGCGLRMVGGTGYVCVPN